MTTTDTIANVTLSVTPALITRRRENFGTSRSRGVEIDYEQRLGGPLDHRRRLAVDRRQALHR